MTQEIILRLTVFALVLGLLLVGQRRRPWHSNTTNWSRLMSNSGLLVGGVMMVRLVLPLSLVQWAIAVEQAQWGLGHWLGGGMMFAVMSFLALDWAIYQQHRLSHRWQWLWAIHRVHHCDQQMDVTTALRFHPLEILLSLGFKMGLVLVLGIGPGVVLIFEIWLNACALFNHSNLRLSPALERWISPWLITPRLHYVHHLTDHTSSNRNFGFSFSCWDRWHHTLQPLTSETHRQYRLGVAYWQRQPVQRLGWLLALPLRRIKAGR